MSDLGQFKETVCSCKKCKDACQRTCWPIPGEADSLIDAGYSARLMLDHWVGSPSGDGYEDVEILCPATPGYEGLRAPEVSWLAAFGGSNPLFGGCVFFEGGLCELHVLGLKPSEGRLSLLCREPPGDSELHQAMATTWESARGREVVARWHKKMAERRSG